MTKSLLKNTIKIIRGTVGPFQRFVNKGRVPVLYYTGTLNVGDVLNPYLIKKLFDKEVYRVISPYSPHVLPIGSIFHHGNQHSHVWGAGIMSPTLDTKKPHPESVRKMSIFAVRGELTKKELIKLGVELEDDLPLGDPAVLLPGVYDPRDFIAKKYRVGIVPHFADQDNEVLRALGRFNNSKIINVQQHPEDFIKDLLSCEFIFSSSLHGLIFSDAYNIPNKWVKFSDKVIGGNFKFEDYYSTTVNEDSTPLFVDSSELLVQLVEESEALCRVSDFKYSKTRLRDAFPTRFL